MNDSAFMRWLAYNSNINLVTIGREGETLVLTVSGLMARRFALGEIDGNAFVGIQQPELIAFDEVAWTHIDVYLDHQPPMMIMSSEGTGAHDRPAPGQLPVRLVMPSRLAAIRQFDIHNSGALDIRRVVVNDQGKVDRVGRLAVRRLPLRVFTAENAEESTVPLL